MCIYFWKVVSTVGYFSFASDTRSDNHFRLRQNFFQFHYEDNFVRMNVSYALATAALWVYATFKPALSLSKAFARHLPEIMFLFILNLWLPVAVMRDCVVYYVTNVRHILYLESIGFLNSAELGDNMDTAESDNGEQHSQERKVRFIPEQRKYLPLSSSAVHQLWRLLSKHVNIESTVLIDCYCGAGFLLLSAMQQSFRKVKRIKESSWNTNFDLMVLLYVLLDVFALNSDCWY